MRSPPLTALPPHECLHTKKPCRLKDVRAFRMARPSSPERFLTAGRKPTAAFILRRFFSSSKENGAQTNRSDTHLPLGAHLRATEKWRKRFRLFRKPSSRPSRVQHPASRSAPEPPKNPQRTPPVPREAKRPQLPKRFPHTVLVCVQRQFPASILPRNLFLTSPPLCDTGQLRPARNRL